MKSKKRIGRYVKSSSTGETYYTYIPKPLPPDPPPNIEDMYGLLEQASTSMGRLDGIRMTLPDMSLFLYMYIRKEAILSSQIEGTQSSLSDLLMFETGKIQNAPINDLNEVSCYISAMEYGLEKIKTLPLSLRLIREIHAKLMNNARGVNAQPGTFRKTQNWIGGTRPGNAYFVPPSPEYLMECLDKFEKFLHDKTIKLPTLIKVALIHVQFETIHPFLDGNGRLGRLLITFILCTENILKEPLLYISLYLKTNRQKYYDLLQSVRETGDWESWIKFFLQGIIETSQQATETAQEIIKLCERDHKKIIDSTNPSVATIHSYFQQNPTLTTKQIQNKSKLSLPTILRNLAILEKMNIVREATGKSRHKVFIYREFINILNKGTEPLPY